MRTFLFLYLDSILRSFSSLTPRFLIAQIFFRQLRKNDHNQADVCDDNRLLALFFMQRNVRSELSCD